MRHYIYIALLTPLVLSLCACGSQKKQSDVWNNYDSHRSVPTEGSSSSDNDSSYSQPHGFGMCGSTQSFGCE